MLYYGPNLIFLTGLVIIHIFFFFFFKLKKVDVLYASLVKRLNFKQILWLSMNSKLKLRNWERR